MYNILYNVRHKYEHNEQIKEQIDLSLRHEFSVDKHNSILELVNIIGDITNILNFEIKNQALKDAQFHDL